MKLPSRSVFRFAVQLSMLALTSNTWTALAAEPAGTSKPNARAEAQQDAARAAQWLQNAFKGGKPTEAAEMLIAIASGSQMGPGDGWFHPSQSRYDWKWLANKHGIKPSEAIPRDKFQGPEALFARLDRDKDGVLRADDFDWSERSPYVMQSSMLNYWFRSLNKSSDGQLTREQWLKFFDEAAGGKDHLTPEMFREALMAGPPAGGTSQGPTQEMLLRGLFSGELGSLLEGPAIGERAPDFRLRTPDGTKEIGLADLLGKPIVLVFGSFT
jgi:hypothetical protein